MVESITEATRERYAALTELMRSEGRGGRWLVLTHDNPDPDALASAQILARVLRQAFRQTVTVAYGGIIGRAENREMVRGLHLPLQPRPPSELKKYGHFALVDTQPRSGNNQLPPRLVPDIVIDHHPVRANTQTRPFYDVRPKYGATATILAEYMLAAASSPRTRWRRRWSTPSAPRPRTSPASTPGPTRRSTTSSSPWPTTASSPASRARACPSTYFGNLHEALENMKSVDSLVVSHLGPVEQPDIVPEIADLLLRMEGKTWSLCHRLLRDRLYLSIRTTNSRADAGTVMSRLVGRRGKGGGHGMMAGGWMDASKVASAADRGDLQRQLGTRLARELKKNPERFGRIELRRKDPHP